MYFIVSTHFFYVIMGKKNYDRINYTTSYHLSSRYKWTTTLSVPNRITHLFYRLYSSNNYDGTNRDYIDSGQARTEPGRSLAEFYLRRTNKQ